MRLNLLRPRSRFSITQRLEKSVLSFSFCPVLVNKTASYCCEARAGRKNQRGPRLNWKKPLIFVNHLLGGETGENRLISYSSFHVMLSLLAAGSSVSPRRQLLAVVNRPMVNRLNSLAARPDVILPSDDPDQGPRIRCVNGLWLDQSLTLKPSFKQILDSHYTAALNPVDFQNKPPHVTQEINSWAENETSGLLNDPIREGFLSNSVKFVFTNSLHFKGAWKYKAHPPFISRRPQENKKLEMDPFMSANNRNALSRPLETVYELFKKQSKYQEPHCLVFGFPTKGTEQGRREHATETLMNICGHETPKFNISCEVEVSDTLRGLGVTLPLSGGKWKGMFSSFGGRKLYVSSIFQKSFMEINEQGAEVVSVTAAVVMSGCPPCLPPVPTLEFEHAYPLDAYRGITAKAGSVLMSLATPLMI